MVYVLLLGYRQMDRYDFYIRCSLLLCIECPIMVNIRNAPPVVELSLRKELL
jgi:hypothetical protein